MQVGSLYPVRYFYDGEGRLSEIKQGEEGTTERVYKLSYHATEDTQKGYLQRIEYKKKDTGTFASLAELTYFPAGRVKNVGDGAGALTEFEYDKSGELTKLTPPRKTGHAFTPLARPDPLKNTLQAKYNPPAVVGQVTETNYDFNLDGQATKVTRPEGDALSLFYSTDGASRLTHLQLPGDTRPLTRPPDITYDQGRVKSIAHPEGIGVSYETMASFPRKKPGPARCEAAWPGP